MWSESSMINLDKGTQLFPIIAECRGVVDGIKCKEFKRVALNGGLLAFYVIPIGVVIVVNMYPKIGLKQVTKCLIISGCIVHNLVR